MTRNSVRVVLILTGLIVAASLAAVLIFRAAFSEARLKRMLIGGARGYLAREVSVDRVSYDFNKGLTATGLSVSEYPDFRAGTFASAASVTFTPELFPLLQGKLFIRDISVDRPVVRIERRQDGSLNTANLLSTGPEGGRNRLFVYGKLTLSIFMVSGLRITGGRFSYVDRLSGETVVSAGDIALSADRIALFSPFDTALTASVDWLGSRWNVSLKDTVDIRNNRLLVREGVLRSDGDSLRVTGSIDHIADNGERTFDLRVSGDRAVVDRAMRAFPAGFSILPPGEKTVDVTIVAGKGNLKVTRNRAR